MLHFTCDLCGRELGDERFVVKVEVFPAWDLDQVQEEDLDADNLDQVSQLVHELEASGAVQGDDHGTKEFRFDLCPRCRRKYAKDPLCREALRRLDFSKN